jgi:hypothetical protein
MLSQLIGFAEAAGLPKTPPISKEQALVLLKKVDWSSWRPQLLELFLHQFNCRHDSAELERDVVPLCMMDCFIFWIIFRKNGCWRSLSILRIYLRN